LDDAGALLLRVLCAAAAARRDDLDDLVPDLVTLCDAVGGTKRVF
jgi:hypothetical protein